MSGRVALEGATARATAAPTVGWMESDEPWALEDAARDDGVPFTALMSSVYTRLGDRWRLALHQQTPRPGLD